MTDAPTAGAVTFNPHIWPGDAMIAPDFSRLTGAPATDSIAIAPVEEAGQLRVNTGLSGADSAAL